METSWPRVRNERALFRSPEIVPLPGDGPICFTFWYHMFGINIGQLAVSVVTEPATPNEASRTVWLLNGQQSVDEFDWLSAQFDVTEILPFQVTDPCPISVRFPPKSDNV